MPTEESESNPNLPPVWIVDWFLCGWNTYRRNPGRLIFGSLLLTASSVLFALLPGGSLVSAIVSPPLIVGYLFTCARLVRGQTAQPVHLFAGFTHFGRVWLTFFLWGLILGLGIFLAGIPYIFFDTNILVGIVAGIVLLGFPYLIWALKYNFAVLATLDRSLSPREAFRFSAKIAEGCRADLFPATLIGFLLPLVCYLPGIREVGSSLFALALPAPNGRVLQLGPLPYIVNAFLILPLVSASWSAAYVGLVSRWEAVGKLESEAPS